MFWRNISSRFVWRLAAPVILLLCSLISAFAAQTVTLSLDTPVLSGNPGGAPLQFSFSIFLAPGPDELMVTELSASLPAGLVWQFPDQGPFTIAPGNVYTGDFNVTIPDRFPSGSYEGVMDMQGELGAQTVDRTANFTVNVNAVPEPATTSLLLAALAAMALTHRFFYLHRSRTA